MTEPLDKLIALGRRQPHGESSRRDLASFQAFERRWERRGRTHRLGVALGLAFAVAGLALWSWPSDASRVPLRYEVAREGQDASDNPALWQLKFSDGSRVALGSNSSAHVGGTSPRGARVVLKRGSATVSVVPRKDGDWWFEAGPYRVHVIGTAFELAWQPERQLLQVSLQRGVVEVTGPLVGKGVTLRAGQRLTAAPKEERLVIDSAHSEGSEVVAGGKSASEERPAGRQPEPEPTAPPAANARLAGLPAGATDLRSRARGRASTDGLRPQPSLDFRSQVARGEFAEVVRSARGAGIAQLLRRAPSTELVALADAARYLREDALARRTLLRLRERFPDSPDGKAAAFFLARLGQGQAAVRWYQRYLAEEHDGPYAKQALGRLMTLHAELGEPELATPLARAYLNRNPGGPYAASARKILTAGATPQGE